jgi:hypothetical protein
MSSKGTPLRFEIKSLNPQIKTVEAVPDAQKLSPELEAAIAAAYPGVTVNIRRVEGIPGVREIQELLIHVDWHAVRSAAEGAAAAFITKEFLKLMKSKLRNIFVKPVESPATGTQQVSQKAPTSAIEVTTPARKARAGSGKTSSGIKQGSKKKGPSRRRRK